MLYWTPNYISSLSLELHLIYLIFKKIKRKDRSPGDRLPSPKELSMQSSVSERSILQAHDQLNKLKLISYESKKLKPVSISILADLRVEKMSIRTDDPFDQPKKDNPFLVE